MRECWWSGAAVTAALKGSPDDTRKYRDSDPVIMTRKLTAGADRDSPQTTGCLCSSNLAVTPQGRDQSARPSRA